MSDSHFIFKYSNPYSVGNDANRDWTIGKNSGLVGCNKNSGIKNHTWVVWNTDKKKYNIGYTGKLTEKEEMVQPWNNEGGNEWNHIYHCTHHIFIGDLDTFCSKHNFDRKIFTMSLMFGHPKPDYLDDLTCAAKIAMTQYT
jgi:hypothetical protein